MYFVREHIMYLTLILTLFAMVNNFLIKNIKSKTNYFIFLILSIITALFLIKFLIPYYFEFFYYFLKKEKCLEVMEVNIVDGMRQVIIFLVNSILYIFYPIFDLSSLQRIIISFENILISLTVLIAVKKYEKKFFLNLLKKKEIFYGLIFFIRRSLAFEFSANIGINSRQKWMVLPSLLIFIAPLIFKSKKYK